MAESFLESPDAEEEMFQLEIQQLILGSERLQQLLDKEEKGVKDLSLENKKEFVRIILNQPDASQAMQNHLSAFSLRRVGFALRTRVTSFGRC